MNDIHEGAWKLVPVEPDEAMLVAARDWSADKYGKPIGNDAAQGCWKAMLAASPVGAAASPWISCAERLPPDGLVVYVAGMYDTNRMSSGKSYFSDGIWYMDEGPTKSLPCGAPDYWFRLPDLPAPIPTATAETKE